MILPLARLGLPMLVFSLVSNLAILVSPIFMMQVLDRVVPTGNIHTLVLLGGLAVAVLVLQALVETARDTALGRVARWVEMNGARAAIKLGGGVDPNATLQASGALSAFLQGPLFLTALNAIWLPAFFFTLFLLHPLFPLALCAFALVQILVTRAARLLSGPAEALAAQHMRLENDSLEQASQYSGAGDRAIVARNLFRRAIGARAARHQAMERTGSLSAGSHAFEGMLRQLVQILALALGAFLVTQDLLTAGGMIAASILMGKTFGILEATISRGPGIWAMRETLAELRKVSQTGAASQTEVPEFDGSLTAKGLTIPRGGGAPPRLDRVSFALDPGQCLVIIGGSGSGKTSLIEALSGQSPAPIGSVFLEQSEIRSLTDNALHKHTGVMSQQSAFVHGTIAENIASFDPEASDGDIVAAAKAAGVHGLISALPQAYDTDLGSDAFLLSAGQKQRLALARAVHSNPSYLFLDEPNALLDAEGERALSQVLARLKSEGCTIVMILHRSGLMGLADKVMRLEDGRCVDFGDRAEVLGRLASGRRQVDLPLLASSLQDLSDWIGSQFTRTSDSEFSQKARLVGTELFNVVLANGPGNRTRRARIEFTFKDDTNCEISILEAGVSEAFKKIAKVKKLVNTRTESTADLPADELSMATITRLSEAFDIHKGDNRSLFRVALSCDPDMQTNGQRQLI